MTQPFRKHSEPSDEFARQIRELQNQVRDLSRPQPMRIPVYSQDPPETDPTSIWLLPDGRLRARHLNTAGTAYVYREWVSTSPGSGTSATAPAAPTTAPISRVSSWPAQWTQSYRQSGPARTDNGTTHLYYGSSGDAFNGRNRSLIGFDYTSIATELAGSTIQDVALRLVNVHSWYYNGSDIHFGIHNFTSEPSSWAGGGIPRSMIHKVHFKQVEDKQISMPLDFAIAIRDGWGRGIALESPSDSRTFYGYAAGVASGHTVPTLIVRYAK